MDYLSDSDELCMSIQGKMMEFMMMGECHARAHLSRCSAQWRAQRDPSSCARAPADESDQVRTVGEAVGECVTTALMPIIDTDGE